MNAARPQIDPANLLAQAAKAAANAHCPYSGFAVGAALLTASGGVFRGCNVENASYGLTNCAERSAVFSAVAQGEQAFSALAIVAGGETLPYPCGACRQVLAEFCSPDTPVYMACIGKQDDFETLLLGELLPKTFKLPPSAKRGSRG